MKTLTYLLTAAVVLSVSSLGLAMSEDEIIAGADARIEKYRTGDVVLQFVAPDGEVLTEGTVARIEQTRHEFLFGCNIFKLGKCRTDADNAAYEKYYSELLNFATLPFYWWNYSNEHGGIDDKRTDEVIKWCREHNITTKGHPLAWNYVDPRWLPDDIDEAMKMQFDRIGRCAKRFEGGIDIWDVVNEATHYDRAQCLQRAPKLTGGITKMGVGAFLRNAFESARKANPDATLIINDYRTDQAYVDKVIKELIDDKGKPMFDVIGIQSHMHGRYWGAKKAWDVCEKYAKFNVPLNFTETTVVSGPKSNEGWNSTPEGEKKQARDATQFYTVLFSHPAVEAITWWDFADQGAWQGAPAGFLRKDMTPKPMYHALKDLIRGKWWTKTEAKTSAGGTAGFRGFYGQYKVSVGSKGQRLTGTFEFDKNTKGKVRVQLQ